MTDKSEKLGVNLTKDQKQKLRVRAAEEGLTMSEYVRELILDDLDNQDEGNSSRMTPTQTMAD